MENSSTSSNDLGKQCANISIYLFLVQAKVFGADVSTLRDISPPETEKDKGWEQSTKTRRQILKSPCYDEETKLSITSKLI